MEDKFIIQPNGNVTPPEIQNDNRFYPYFKDCQGVMDGTHVPVKVAGAEALKFRGRKGFPSQNVLVACTFDLKFTYVLAGWEGSASVSRIVKDALYSREDKLRIPFGKYYLGDAGYMLKPCLITPYRGVRYHLKEYSSHGPVNMQELFNHRHASLRNAINMGKRKNMDAQTSSALRRTVPMDKVLIEALMNEVVNGNRVDGSFTSQGYGNVLKECTQKLGHPFTKDNLKNRLKTIKSNFNEVYDLFGASGWGWNKEKKVFESEEEVWDSLLEKNPDARKWKHTPFHHYDLLAKLFLKDRTTGDDASTAKEKKLQTTSTTAESGDKTASTVEAKLNDSKDTGDSKNSKKSKRKLADEHILEEISTIKHGLVNVAQALREGNKVMEERNKLMEESRPRVYTNQMVFEVLSDMELDSITCRKAYRLSATQARVREFFGCPIEQRRELLTEMMSDEHA